MSLNQRLHKLTFIKNAISSFLGIALIWLALLILIHFGEIILNGNTHQYPEDLLTVVAWAVLLDFVFWIKWLFWEFLLYVIIYRFNTKIAKIVYVSILTILAIIQVALIQYFNKSLVPLGADVYGYSAADIKQTISASGGVGIFAIMGILIIAILVIASTRFLYNKIKAPFLVGEAILILSFFVSLSSITDDIKPVNLSSDFAANMVINKSDYFFKNSYSHFYPKLHEVDIYADSYIGDYAGQPFKINSFDYIDNANYPFLHKKNVEDVLSPFFNQSKTKPNIIIILVEGLGRAFTNQGAYLGNFTPYLDSLAQNGLYWKNFLSQGGRTFAVLPALTASLPFAKNGFLALGGQMPNHLSLFNILKHNGYSTSFYYGGNSTFDNMKQFLNQNQVDEIKDEFTFPNRAIRSPAVNGFSWGYTDDALFSHFLNTSKPLPIGKSKLSVILTLTMHDPFLIDRQTEYLKKFENRLNELSFDEQEKKTYQNYKLQYASILYTDDAIKRFINSYKDRPDYENTIFLITGDHRMPEIPMSSKIDRYHVPLIIYSPLIKRTATFSSISTHFDIVPSLISYLEKNYQIEAPSLVAWMGDGLDTTRRFQNRHSYPLMQTKTDLTDYILDVYHLNGSSLFRMKSDMSEETLNDDEIKDRLQSSFNAYKRKSARIVEGSKILPDSIYKKYTTPKN